ncbi:MAG: hypothetical protein KDC48_21635, partial [Planctomycetes bacterium]|nr:hypothetical protein [Planctomycetota bacterium]
PEVLFKQGRLDMDEWRWMTQHPRLGAQLLIEQRERIDPSAVGAAFCHHMAPGGHGYPRPAVPVEPSGTSRLIRVCDVFEALTAVRPYKLALTPIEAFAVMFRNEGEFDPSWLRRFVRTIGLFPNGTRVQLDCGSDAIVVAQTADLTGPLVRLLTGPDGADLPSSHPGELQIGAPFEGRVPRIAGVATPERHVVVPEQDEATDGFDRTVHTACFTPSATGDHHHHHDHG